SSSAGSSSARSVAPRPERRLPPPDPGIRTTDRHTEDVSTDRVELRARYGFPLDAFQLHAIDALDAGQSVLVAAPTGSGKTVVAEYAIAQALGAGRRSFYTAPIKALSNQKFLDLGRIHGPDRVGLLTGDNAI